MRDGFISFIRIWYMVRYGQDASILWWQQQIAEQYSASKFRNPNDFKMRNKLLSKYRNIHFGIYPRRKIVLDALKIAGISLVTAIVITAFNNMMQIGKDFWTVIGYFFIILVIALAGITILAGYVGTQNKTYLLYLLPYKEAVLRELLEKYHGVTFEAGKPVIHYDPPKNNSLLPLKKPEIIPDFEKTYRSTVKKAGEYLAVQQTEQEIRIFYANERFKSEEGKRTLFMHFNDSQFKEKSSADKKAEIHLQIRTEITVSFFTAAFLSVALSAISEPDANIPTTVFMWAVLLLGLLFSHIWGDLLSDWREKSNSAYYQYVVPFRTQLIKELLEQVHHVEFKNGLPVVEPLPQPKAPQPEASKDEPAKTENAAV